MTHRGGEPRQPAPSASSYQITDDEASDQADSDNSSSGTTPPVHSTPPPREDEHEVIAPDRPTAARPAPTHHEQQPVTRPLTHIDGSPIPTEDHVGGWAIRRLSLDEQKRRMTAEEWEVYETPRLMLDRSPDDEDERQTLIKRMRLPANRPEFRDATYGIQPADPERLAMRQAIDRSLADIDKLEIKAFKERFPDANDSDYDSDDDPILQVTNESGDDIESFYAYQKPQAYSRLGTTADAGVFLKHFGVVAFLNQGDEEDWAEVDQNIVDALANNWHAMCELNSKNDQGKENEGLRRYLIPQRADFRWLKAQAIAYSEMFHPGISKSQRFKDEIPTLLITLAGALGQMGHWDEHELRVFLNQCVDNWCLQLFLFPHGGNIKIALKSHELLQQRPYVGTRKRFRLAQVPMRTTVAAYRGTGHAGAAWGTMCALVAKGSVNKLRITPRVWDPLSSVKTTRAGRSASSRSKTPT